MRESAERVEAGNVPHDDEQSSTATLKDISEGKIIPQTGGAKKCLFFTHNEWVFFRGHDSIQCNQEYRPQFTNVRG